MQEVLLNRIKALWGVEIDPQRLSRAREIPVKEIQTAGDKIQATVESTRAKKPYYVEISSDRVKCTCPDHRKRKRVCKHILAVVLCYPAEVEKVLPPDRDTAEITEAAYIPLDEYEEISVEFFDTPFGPRREIRSLKTGRIFVEPVIGNGASTKGILKHLKTIVEGLKSLGSPVNVLVYGPPGIGKTYLGRILAVLYRTKFYLQRIFPYMELENLFGYVRAHSGSTIFKPTDFTRSVQAGKGVLVLDEANTNPALLLSLHEFLNQRTIEIEGESYSAHNLIVLANGNPGFRNTHEINEATESRFYPIHLEADPGVDYLLLMRMTNGKLEEELIKDIVKFLQDIREWSREENVPGAYCGFRDTLQFVVPLLGGGKITDAVDLLVQKLQRRTGDPIVAESVRSLAHAIFPQVAKHVAKEVTL